MLAVGILLMVDCYLRPSELLGLQNKSLLAPGPHGAHWSLILHPQEGRSRSKTGNVDETILLNSARLRWMAPVLRQIHQGPPESYILNLTYPEFSRQFSEVADALEVAVVPYQGRHSGPSIDRAERVRSAEEIQKRGRWKHHRSVTRYEKAGLLQKSWQELSAVQQTYFQTCADQLPAVILHGAAAPVRPRRLA